MELDGGLEPNQPPPYKGVALPIELIQHEWCYRRDSNPDLIDPQSIPSANWGTVAWCERRDSNPHVALDSRF